MKKKSSTVPLQKKEDADADIQNYLVVNEDRFDRIEALVLMGTWQMTGNAEDVFWSDGFYRLHGLVPQSVKPSTSLRLSMVHPDDRGRLANAFNEALLSGKSYNLEKRILLPDGTIRWVLSKGEVLIDEVSGIKNIFGVIIDVTDRKLVELQKIELAKSLDDFQKAIQGSSIVSRADKSGVITYVNSNFVEISGYSSDELINQNHRILSSNFHPRAFWVNMWKTIANGRVWRADVKNRAKNGTFYWVDTSIVPFLGSDGEVKEFLSIRNDITQRKAQEESIFNLNRSLADFQDAIQYSSIVSRANKVGIITYVNENFIKVSGYSGIELIGQNHRIINSGFHSKEFWKDMWKTIAGGSIWRSEVKNKAKDGSFYWVDTFVIPFLDEKGQVKEFLSIRNDITSRKEAEEALIIAREKAEIANKAKSEFLANMSHEIRTPLNGIIGFSDLLLMTNLNPIQEQYMTTISRSANGLLDIINDVLDFSKIEAGKMELLIEPTDLFVLCSQVVQIVSQQALNKGIRLFYTCHPNTPSFVMVDSIRLKQVLVNLLGNAIKFTETGEIELKIEPVESSILHINMEPNLYRFSVRDTGVGIQFENQTRIFEAFSQEDASVTKKYGGTGLGLSISNRILKLMDSKLMLISTPGIGSTFFFDVLLEEIDRPEELSEANQSGAKLNKVSQVTLSRDDRSQWEVTVLIAEDNMINMELTKAIVSNVLPHALLLEAINGEHAVEIFAKRKPNIIFMDVQMPEMNGLESTMRIRAIEENDLRNPDEHVPIIALTASATEAERARCLEAGMNDFIVKPIINRAVERAIDTWLLKTGPKEKIDKEDKKHRVDVDVDLINLDLLKKLLKGNKEQIIHVLTLFSIHVPPILERMKQELRNKEWVKLMHTVHGIKSYYSYLAKPELNIAINNWEANLKLNAEDFDHHDVLEMLEHNTTGIGRQIRQILKDGIDKLLIE